MSELKIGWAEYSLVPEKKTLLPGQMYERISEYVESEISVTALAIESGDSQSIILSADLIKISEELLQRVRECFAKRCPEVDPMNLILCATHVHTSLNYYMTGVNPGEKVLNEFLPADKQYQPIVQVHEDILTAPEAMELIAWQASAAAAEAWNSRKKAHIAHAFGRAAVGFCRRAVYSDGSAEMWGDTNRADFEALEGGNDSGVELLYTYDEDRKLTGVVANVACPAQIMEHRSFISSDYWGKAKEYIRNELGENIFLLALCGAGGDQCPRDLVRWVNPETPILDPQISRPNYFERNADPSMFDLSGCRLAGRRIAGEIVSLSREIKPVDGAVPFLHRSFVLDLPLRKVSASEYQHAVREIEYYVSKNREKEVFDFQDKTKVFVHIGVIRRYRQQQTQETIPVEIHILRIGDAALVTNPFELFLDYGNRIRARSRARQTFIAQLSCGSRGYLPTAKAEKGGHYSAYVTSGTVGHEGGDLLVRKCIDEVNKLF